MTHLYIIIVFNAVTCFSILIRRCEGRSEYYQQLLWRPGPQSPHGSHQSHGRTAPHLLPVSHGCIQGPQSVYSETLSVLLCVFQLQLHERGMKTHQIIYDQVRQHEDSLNCLSVHDHMLT